MVVARRAKHKNASRSKGSKKRYGKRPSAWSRGYNHRWNEYRKLFLKENPLCAYHKKIGQVVAAEVVDHIRPHRGDYELFWDTDNHQALCTTCHNAIKQAEEANGYLRGADHDGFPLDEKHHWNA